MAVGLRSMNTSIALGLSNHSFSFNSHAIIEDGNDIFFMCAKNKAAIILSSIMLMKEYKSIAFGFMEMKKSYTCMERGMEGNASNTATAFDGSNPLLRH